MRFDGKHVIVTGAGRGIGAATARRFAAEGADVLLVSRTESELEHTAESIRSEGGEAWTFVADVSRAGRVQAAVDAAVGRWGRIDVLVNNAGIGPEHPFLEIPEEAWQATIAVNLSGPFLFSQRVAREMVKTGGGVILHNASIDALGAEIGFAPYNSAKAGLFGLNTTMAVELAPYGIRSNIVCPGYTETPLTEQTVGARLFAYMRDSFERVPMRRLVSADEIAAAFAFLASDDASAITGIALPVDGGTTANLYILETLPGD